VIKERNKENKKLAFAVLCQFPYDCTLPVLAAKQFSWPHPCVIGARSLLAG